MFVVSQVWPSNGGVLVLVENHPALIMGEPMSHSTAVVLSKGNGVPWLSVGDRVAFPLERATAYSLPTGAVPWLCDPRDIPKTERTTVCLVDQRDIHATVARDDNPNAMVAAFGAVLG